MNQMAKIKEEYTKTIERLRCEMQAVYREILVDAGLDGDVIDKESGRRGVIRIRRRDIYSVDAEYIFYPYRINGELSKSCQNVWVGSDYRPDGEERLKQGLISKYDPAPKAEEIIC